MADKTGTTSFEFVPDVAEVIDLAVVDDPIAGFGIVHGLVGQRGKIENRQSSVTQADLNGVRCRLAKKDRTRVIGSSMREGLRAAFKDTIGNSRVPRDEAEDSAH